MDSAKVSTANTAASVFTPSPAARPSSVMPRDLRGAARLYRILAPDPGRRLCWLADWYANLRHHARSRRRRRLPRLPGRAGRLRASGPRADCRGRRRQRRSGRALRGRRREGDRARRDGRPGPRPQYRRGGGHGRRAAVHRRRCRRASRPGRARGGASAGRRRPCRRDWLVRRCPGRPGIPLAVPEPAAPLRAPDEPRRGDDVLVRLRRDPARGVSRRGRIQRGLQRPVDRGHRVRLSAAAGRPQGPPCERPPGDASQALDAAVAAAHRRVRARRAVDAADHPLARPAERPERQDEFARERRARIHAVGRARLRSRGCGGARRRPCSRASASWC